jgi:hypothetical protein
VRKRVKSRRPRQAGGPPTRASVSRAGLRLLRKQGPQGFGARRGSESSRLPPELENRRPSQRGRAAQAGGAAGGGCDARFGCIALRLNRGLRFVKPALSARRCLGGGFQRRRAGFGFGELPLPETSSGPSRDRNPDELDGKLVLGNDPDEYVQEIRSYAEAGYTHVYVHQIGPEQEAFLKFAKSELFSRPRRSLHGAKGHRPSLCSRIAQPTIKGGSR